MFAFVVIRRLRSSGTFRGAADQNSAGNIHLRHRAILTNKASCHRYYQFLERHFLSQFKSAGRLNIYVLNCLIIFMQLYFITK